jgi:hypothetical protein
MILINMAKRRGTEYRIQNTEYRIQNTEFRTSERAIESNSRTSLTHLGIFRGKSLNAHVLRILTPEFCFLYSVFSLLQITLD